MAPTPVIMAFRLVIILFLFILFSPGHITHLFFESRPDYHHHMYDQKEQERNGCKKVNGTGGLGSKEHF